MVRFYDPPCLAYSNHSTHTEPVLLTRGTWTWKYNVQLSDTQFYNVLNRTCFVLDPHIELYIWLIIAIHYYFSDGKPFYIISSLPKLISLLFIIYWQLCVALYLVLCAYRIVSADDKSDAVNVFNTVSCSHTHLRGIWECSEQRKTNPARSSQKSLVRFRFRST